MARIDLIDVCRTLGDRGRGASNFSIRNLNLTVPDGKTMVVVGPSGCGKSTLLRLMGGLIRPDSGQVRYDGVDVGDVPPGDRRIGMVFQNLALYPHISSRNNVLSYFWFRNRTPALDAEARARFERTSELMGVELIRLLERKPPRLSGGEQQRVAIGRCVTRDARLFLVDEPFAHLEQALREKYRLNLRLLLQQFDITTVCVTHDHHEAWLLADLLAVMDRGRIEQVGTPQAVYDQPNSAFVAEFLNLNVGAPSISFIEPRGTPLAQGAEDVRIGVRPEHVEVSGARRSGALEGLVTHALRLPPYLATLLTIRVGEQTVHAQVPGCATQREGDRVWLSLRRYHVFDCASGARVRSVGAGG